MKQTLGHCKRALTLVAFGGIVIGAQADYRDHDETRKFVAEMVSEHSFTEAELNNWFKSAHKQQNILEAIARPAEHTKTWKEYRPLFIMPLRVTNGVAFWKEHKEVLARAEKTYGVPAELIVSIIGIETNYGRNMGSHKVIDALSTLAFDYPPRSPFFRQELKNYFLLIREQKQDPLMFKGSYAGAMGYGQFMPSSYRHYAVDFDGDGFTDIWNNTTDAIGSVANYFSKHGWQTGLPVVFRARFEGDAAKETFNSIQEPTEALSALQARGFTIIGNLEPTEKLIPLELDGQHGLEYWVGTKNFYVISRYNRSHLYSMAVQQLSVALKDAMEAN